MSHKKPKPKPLNCPKLNERWRLGYAKMVRDFFVDGEGRFSMMIGGKWHCFYMCQTVEPMPWQQRVTSFVKPKDTQT